MEFRLAVVGPDHDAAIEDLWQWLHDQDRLGGRVRLDTGAAAPGSMGAAFGDTLAVALGSGGAVTVLAQALIVWLKQPRGVKLRLKVIGADGVTTELDADRLTDVEGTIRAALQAPADDATAEG